MVRPQTVTRHPGLFYVSCTDQAPYRGVYSAEGPAKRETCEYLPLDDDEFYPGSPTPPTPDTPWYFHETTHLYRQIGHYSPQIPIPLHPVSLSGLRKTFRDVDQRLINIVLKNISGLVVLLLFIVCTCEVS